MKLHQDIAYLNWVRSTIQNEEILYKIDTTGHIWPRQFLFRLLYIYEDSLEKKTVDNIKFYLEI